MKIAVTGASGHVGINLCRSLIDAGHNIRALVHKNKTGLESLNLEFIEGDILDPGSLHHLAEETDVFIHLAGLITISNQTGQIRKINVEGTKNILDICIKNHIPVIHFSSIHAYNIKPVHDVLDENRPLDLQHKIAYNQTKAESHLLVRQAFHKGLRGIIFSPTSILGPFDYRPSLQSEAIIKFYRGKIPALVPGGYDWVDVRDIASVVISALEKPLNNQEYILSGHWKSVVELAHAITASGGKKPPSFTCPFWLARIGVPFLNIGSYLTGTKLLYTAASLDALQYSTHNISSDKAKRDFNFQPRPFEETVADTINWLKNNRLL